MKRQDKNEDNYILGEDFIQLPSMKNCKVLAGNHNLLNKIRGANVIEVPDIIDWVQPNDVLITTAYPFRDNLTHLTELIEEFAKKKIAGIAIKPKRFIDTITTDIIEKANEVGIFLIELSADAVFSNIVFETVQAISYKSMSAYWLVQERTDQLLSRLSSMDTVNDMLDCISHDIKRNILLLDNEGNVVSTREDSITKELGLNSIDKEEVIRLVKDKDNEQREITCRINGLYYEFYISSFSRSESSTYYILINQTENKLTTVEYRLLENIIPILSLQIKNSDILQKKVIQYRDRFILDWIKGNIVDKLDIILFAKEFGIQLNGESNYQVGILSFKEIHSDKTIQEQLSQLQYHFYRLKIKFLIAVENGEFIIVIETASNEATQKILKDFLEELRMEAGENLMIALSGPQPLNLVSIAYHEVRKIKEISRKCRIQGDIIQYADLGIYTILSLIPNQREVQNYISRFIDPLLEYDRHNNSKLIETLIVYYETGCNALKASKCLFIHYNTMMYRIDKVKSLIGMDINDVEIRLQLQVALKLNAIEYKENGNGRSR